MGNEKTNVSFRILYKIHSVFNYAYYCMDNSHKLTTIALTKENYDKLRKLGYTGESFNTVVTRLLENVEQENRN